MVSSKPSGEEISPNCRLTPPNSPVNHSIIIDVLISDACSGAPVMSSPERVATQDPGSEGVESAKEKEVASKESQLELICFPSSLHS